MRFLGRGILTEDERPYPLVVPLPALEARRNWSIRILESGTVVFDTPSWRRARLPVRLSLSERNQHQFVLEIQST